MKMFAILLTAAVAPILHPGAPGEDTRELTPEQAIEIADSSYSPDDVKFLQDMIPHHHQAVEMSALVPDRTNREEIKDVAGRITASQEDEIEFMTGWLTERGEEPTARTDIHAMHTTHKMAGMATPEEMAELATLTGTDFDRMFLQLMIPHHEGAIALAFFDVDFYASLHDCLINLWPWVIDGGHVCTDEYRNVAYCSVFFSEKYWDKYFSCPPPGLVGIGTGVQVGMVYTDNTIKGMGPEGKLRMLGPESVAYCVKGNEAMWDYYPDEIEADSA